MFILCTQKFYKFFFLTKVFAVTISLHIAVVILFQGDVLKGHILAKSLDDVNCLAFHPRTLEIAAGVGRSVHIFKLKVFN